MRHCALPALLAAAATLAQPVVGAEPVSDAQLAQRVRVGGLRISAESRVAIVNDRLVSAGERIDGVEVLAIAADRVHLRAHGRTFAMRVGSALIHESHLQEPPVAAASLRLPDRYGPVAPGETLSEIAERLRPRDVDRTTLMAALFAANPTSFGGDMDTLFAGASLHVPTIAATSLSAAERLADTARPPPITAPPPDPADDAAVHAPPSSKSPDSPLLVTRGDTLSEIAVAVARSANVTLNQAMSAIYDGNPHAFGGDMNLLFAGAVLELPDTAQLHARAPSAALQHVQRLSADRSTTAPANAS